MLWWSWYDDHDLGIFTFLGSCGGLSDDADDENDDDNDDNLHRKVWASVCRPVICRANLKILIRFLWGGPLYTPVEWKWDLRILMILKIWAILLIWLSYITSSPPLLPAFANISKTKCLIKETARLNGLGIWVCSNMWNQWTQWLKESDGRKM